MTILKEAELAPAAGLAKSRSPLAFGPVLRGSGHVMSWVCLLTVLCWLPYFAPAVVPIHDTLNVTESFHCFYSALRCQGEFIRWFPYGNYGIPADFYQLALHPTHYVAAIGGLLLGVDDTLLLAKIAMLLNELLLALGLYLLSRELFSLPLTQFLVSIGGVLSISWFGQAMFNLFLYYMLPLVMFLVFNFFKTKKPTYLFLAGITEICSLLGNVKYAVPLHFWILALFAAVLVWEYPQAVKRLVSPKTLVNPWLWVFLAVIGVIGGFMAGATADLSLLSPDRDPTTGQTTLATFLDYGRPPMAAAALGLTTGALALGDNSYYIGLLPLAMFVYALATESRKTFLAIASVCLALVWLSIGGWFATPIFFLPGMSLYRHTALIYGIIGVLLLLGSGFGFERLALRLSGRATAPLKYPLPRTAVLIALVAFILADFWYCRYPKEPPLPAFTPGWQAFFTFRLAVFVAAAGGVLVYTVACALRRRGPASSGQRTLLPAYLVLLAFLFDVGSYRVQILESLPRMDPEFVTGSVFTAVETPYRAMRSNEPVDDRSRAVLEFLTRDLPFNSTKYSLLYGFAGFDPCRPMYRTDVLSRGMYDMLVARGGQPTLYPNDGCPPQADVAFKRSLGCGAPKLRLTTRPYFAETEAEAARLFTGLADPDAAVVLSPGGETADDKPNDREYQQHEPDQHEMGQLGVINVTAFSSNHVEALVVVEHLHPVWLVYADSWNPGWKARVDGHAVPVRRANLGLKAVRLESGTHEVEFYFFNRGRTYLAWGVALIGTTFGIALCTVLLTIVLLPGCAHFEARRQM